MGNRQRDQTRRQFLRNASVATGLLSGACARMRPSVTRRPKAASRPNILLLVTDDQRWDSMSCMGNPILRTPNMDRLASEGTLFTNAFCTTAICAASRASILTGQYTRIHGIQQGSADPFTRSTIAMTCSALLREAGYHTGFIGKWGLGGDLPRNQFDVFDGFSGQGKYFRTIGGETVHLTGLLGRQAVNFLRGSPEGQPFFLQVSFKAPHVQDQDVRQYLYDPAYESLYKDVTIPLPEMAGPCFFEALPGFIRESLGRERWHHRFAMPRLYQRSVKGYYRLVAGVDAVLGDLRATLEELGLDESTAIILISDNGVFLGERGLAGKWLMHEESIRIPLVIRDPRMSVLGQRRAEMALNIDVAPTILELAGVDIPSYMQGRSLVSLLQGQRPEWRGEWFYEHHYGPERDIPIPPSEGVRTTRWKYVRYLEPYPFYEELYDLETDPHEKHNLALEEAYKDQLAQLRERWQAWRAALESWRPDGTQPWRDPA